MKGPGAVPIPNELPILRLSDVILFPYSKQTVELKGEEEIALADAALSGERFLAVFGPGESDEEIPVRGTAARIERMHRRSDGTIRLQLCGIARVDRLSIVRMEPFPFFTIRPAPAVPGHDLRIEELKRTCLDAFVQVIRGSSVYRDELIDLAEKVKRGGHLADLIASNLNLSHGEMRFLVDTEDVEERLEEIARLLKRESRLAEIETRIKGEVESALGKKEKDEYLRQQIRTIRKELGEDDEREIQIRELNRRFSEVVLPGPAESSCLESIARLSMIPVQSSEFATTRNHIDWILGLPWTAASEDAIDLKRAREILDANHHGLEKIKERVLEFLAVRKVKRDSPSPMLCFAGPPGVGKTSLGHSIAVALGRRTARLSLGGMTDEGEIRGHRRTYSGALPGRILQELRRVGVRNPVFMLDEIDKLGSDFNGDPSAPLLEVLDPEQNRVFTDHYLNLPFDLSEVFFITTANSVENIPPGLFDRLEVIEFPGYTTTEKVTIAENYLTPKQLAHHGLESRHVAIRRGAIRKIIGEYALESGLRDLERSVAAILRKRTMMLLEGEEGRIVVTRDNLSDYLGNPRYYPDTRNRKAEVGTTTALAWTPLGGKILFIEATMMPGRQSLQITGHLGEVMRESAEMALSYVRSFLDRRGAPPDLLENRDIHIHVPEGSISKDGPSAGVAIAVSLYSLFTSFRVRPDVAMTGELTLRGHILPVGGMRQKILGAYNTGIKHVLFPAKNEPELSEIPEEVRKKVELIPVEHVEEVFQLACLPPAGRKR